METMETIDNFVKSKKIPFIKNKNDVYMLIRMGGLKTVKKGKRTFIVTDYESESNADVKEKRNKKIKIFIPQNSYKLLAVVANHSKKEVEELIDEAIVAAEDVIKLGSTEEKVPIEICKEQVVKIVKIEKEIRKIKKVFEKKDIKLNEQRIASNFAMFFLFLIYFALTEYKKQI